VNKITAIFLPPFIIQSLHYKAISTTYEVERKILHYLVHALQSNIPMDILRSYVHISVKKKNIFTKIWLLDLLV